MDGTGAGVINQHRLYSVDRGVQNKYPFVRADPNNRISGRNVGSALSQSLKFGNDRVDFGRPICGVEAKKQLHRVNCFAISSGGLQSSSHVIELRASNIFDIPKQIKRPLEVRRSLQISIELFQNEATPRGEIWVARD